MSDKNFKVRKGLTISDSMNGDVALAVNSSGKLTVNGAGLGAAATPTAAGVVYGITADSSGTRNAAIGHNALHDGGSSYANVAIGTAALYSVTSGSFNVAIGNSSLTYATGNANTMVGDTSGYGVTTGQYNVGVGGQVLQNVTTGGNNTAIGFGAGGVTTGSNNIILGYEASASANNASNEIVIGNHDIARLRIPGLGIDTNDAGSEQILAWNPYGGWNGTGGFAWADYPSTPYASFSGVGMTTSGKVFGQAYDSNSNTALGYGSLSAYIVGDNNVAVGYNAMNNNLTGNGNTVIGNDINVIRPGLGDNNIIIGNDATPSTSNVSNEITIGNNDINRLRIPGLGLDTNNPQNGQVLAWSSGGGYNGNGGFTWIDSGGPTASPTTYGSVYGSTGGYTTTLGYNATDVNGPSSTTAIGAFAAYGITGNYNLAIGEYSLYGAGGTNNVAIGPSALSSTTTAHDNVVIGYANGLSLSTGSKNVIIGSNGEFASSLATGNNNIIIGANANSSSSFVSNEITLGNINATRLRIPGLNLDTADATNGKVLTWSDGITGPWSNTGFVWADAAGGSAADPLTLGSVYAYQPGGPSASNYFGNGAGSGQLGGTNIAIGNATLSNGAHQSSIAIGNDALGHTGDNNSVAIGHQALYSSTTGSNNVAIGQYAGYYTENGTNNVILGYNASGSLTSGQDNVIIGADVDSQNTLSSGSNNIIIGSGANPSNGSVNNEITLGNYSIASFRIPAFNLTINGSKSAGTLWYWNGSTFSEIVPPDGTPGTLQWSGYAWYVA